MIALSFLFMNVLAQSTHPLRGMVIDQVLRQPLPGATITLKELNTSVVTDQDGAFRFSDLSVGTYSLAISYAGFKDALLENISVNAGKETVLTSPTGSHSES